MFLLLPIFALLTLAVSHFLEVARHGRHVSKRRQKWVWGSIAAVITLGTAALAWSYLPTGRWSSSTHHFQNPEGDDVAD